jgi:hypothetical protein
MTVQSTGASPVEAIAGLAGATPAATAPTNPANAETVVETDPLRQVTNPEPRADPGRAGGAEALKADLATERDARQAAQTAASEAAAKLDAVLTALGLKTTETEDPAKLVESSQATARAAQLELAAVRNAPKGTDIVDLLDSRRFVDGLQALDPANGPAISGYITKFLQDNPALGVRYAGGAGDVRAQGEPPAGSGKSFDDLIRGR